MSKEDKKNTWPSQHLNRLYCTTSLSVLVQTSSSYLVCFLDSFGRKSFWSTVMTSNDRY